MAAEEAGPELELRDYLRVLRRRKWTIILAVLVVLGAAITSAELQTPVYRSGALILLHSSNPQ
ncbi:MAG TPA: Wzz/FepE/Etk N-terminal domain-containing protein, partial [Acidimicrobiales bacterium]